MSLCNPEEKRWNVDLLNSICEPSLIRAIAYLSWPQIECANKLIWKNSASRKFSMKEGFKKIITNRVGNDDSLIWGKIW